LNLPDGTDPTDSRRRGEDGRDRANEPTTTPNDATTSATDAATSTDPKLPATAKNLQGLTIALIPASAGADPTDAAVNRTVTILGQRAACAPKRNVERLPLELSLAARVERLLDDADATSLRVDDSKRFVPCVAERIQRQESADLVLIIEAVPGGASRVRLPRTTKTAAAADLRMAQTLTSELAAALGLGTPVPATPAAEVAALTAAGAVDQPGGAAVAYVRVGVKDDSDATLDALALDLMRALAATATRELPAPVAKGADAQSSGGKASTTPAD